MVEDLTGLSKLAESPVVNKGYDDLAGGPFKETGKALTDVVKSFRLFLAPLQLLAVSQDRLARYCEAVRNSVPEERQIEASPTVAIPVLLGLRQTEAESPLIDLYLNLLRCAIDKEHVGEAHPAFAKLIEQMCPDEAMIMLSLAEQDNLCLIRSAVQSNSFPWHRLVNPELVDVYAYHLESLNLVNAIAGAHFVELTPFGQLFIRACVPTDVVVSTDRVDE